MYWHVGVTTFLYAYFSLSYSTLKLWDYSKAKVCGGLGGVVGGHGCCDGLGTVMGCCGGLGLWWAGWYDGLGACNDGCSGCHDVLGAMMFWVSGSRCSGCLVFWVP